MSRKQSIKSLLGSTESKPRTRNKSVTAAVVVGLVMGSAGIAGTTYAYTKGYNQGIAVATLSQETKATTNKVNYTPESGFTIDMLELPPTFEEASAHQPAERTYY